MAFLDDSKCLPDSAYLRIEGKISQRVGGHPNYFSHHSSVDKDVREYVEFLQGSAGMRTFRYRALRRSSLGSILAQSTLSFG